MCQEDIISTNFKRHWPMQHANGLTAPTFRHISFSLVGFVGLFVCLFRVAGTCPSLPVQNYFCISECEKNKAEEKNETGSFLLFHIHLPSPVCAPISSTCIFCLICTM